MFYTEKYNSCLTATVDSSDTSPVRANGLRWCIRAEQHGLLYMDYYYYYNYYYYYSGDGPQQVLDRTMRICKKGL